MTIDKTLIAELRSAKFGDEELRASLKLRGWLAELPGYADENGVILVGNRRVRIAKEEGIKPIIKTLTFGKGDEADAKRIGLALASNTGGVSITKAERKHFAEYLYTKRNWTMKRIAEAFDVSERTISEDLRNSEATSELPRAKSATNPKGAGRPKGASKAATKEKSSRRKVTPTQDAVIEAAYFEQGKTRTEIAKELGIGEHAVQNAIERGHGRREAEPQIDPATLSMSQQEKFKAALRQYKKKLDVEFEQRLFDAKEEMVERYRPVFEDAVKVRDNRRGLVTKVEADTITRCLHPDNSASEKMRNNAFVIWQRIKNLIMSGQDAPTVIRFDQLRRKKKAS